MRAAQLGAGVLAMMLALAIGPGLPSASAAVIPGAVTAITVTPSDPVPGEDVRLDLTWAVPDTANAGDTFTIDLPGELRRITTAFTLTDGSGAVIANAVVTNGLVTFTLTNYVDTHNNVHGSAYFWAQIDYDVEPGVVVLDFGTIESTITVKPGGSGSGTSETDRTRPTKSGNWWDPEAGFDVEGDYIYYSLQSPKGPFDEVVIDDFLGPGQQNICSGSYAPIVRMLGVDSNGDYTNVITYPPASDRSITCAETTMTVTVKNVPADTIVEVLYRVLVVDKSLTTYTNSATVKANGRTDGVESTVVRTGAGGTGTGENSAVAVTKTADPASGTTVTPGQTVRYTLTFDHSGNGAAAVDYTDHLADVLDDATFGSIVSAGGLTVAGPQDGLLRITGSITADTTVVYTVVVKGSGRGDNVLRNVVAKGTDTPGPDDPKTEHPVRYVYIQKLGDGSPLDGAVFVLRADASGAPGADLTTPTLTAVPGKAGLLVTGAIEPGTYWLEERKAPAGFELLPAPVRFVVAADGTVTLSAPSANGLVSVTRTAPEMSTISVTNQRRPYTLPLTGGTGETVFLGAGVVLFAVGVTGASVRRRKAIKA